MQQQSICVVVVVVGIVIECGTGYRVGMLGLENPQRVSRGVLSFR